jgi:uncharacterized protein YecT (DUF1311 family)
MENLRKWLLLIIAAICSQLVFADCAKGNVYEDLSCYEKQIQLDKARLNKLYGALSRSIDSEGQKQLELSQKAWLIYRDAQCDGLMGYYGSQAQGAGSALIQQSCISEKLSQRIKELNDLK